MKNKLFISALLIVVIMSCRKDSSEVGPMAVATKRESGDPGPGYAARTTTDSLYSSFIPKSLANQMIGSYLYSIASDTDGNDLKAFLINADSLRSYLSNSQIKNIKLAFGHTTEYMSSGNTGVFAGMRSGALTIIIVGYDSVGNYIYRGESVLDHALPCPFSCPPGDAGGNVLQ